MEDSNDEVAPVGKLESFIINQDSPTPGIINQSKIIINNYFNKFIFNKLIILLLPHFHYSFHSYYYAPHFYPVYHYYDFLHS